MKEGGAPLFCCFFNIIDMMVGVTSNSRTVSDDYADYN